MKISVTNIGPVRKADIELDPLTIFIGPNNTGKSIIATVLYAALSHAGVSSERGMERTVHSGLWTPLRNNDETAAADEAIIRSSPEEKITFSSIPESVRDLFAEQLTEMLRDRLPIISEEIERASGAPLRSLRRSTGKRSATATVTLVSEKPAWQARITVSASNYEMTVARPPDIQEFLDLTPKPLLDLRSRRKNITPTARLSAVLAIVFFGDLPLRTWYLPAGRTGILQSYRVLARSIIRGASVSGIGDSREPALTGVIADFLGEMVGLDPQAEGEFAEEARQLEEEVLHGQITLQGEPSPEVVYRTGAGDYPIRRTSSMVSELAPVVLYLRHRLHRDDLLIIEEPEGHLHPAAQVAFARCLVRLVNKGLRVVLTTHSEFFLEQINTAIMAGALPTDRVADLNVASEQLDAGKVAAYFFEPKASGTNVVRLPVNPKEGIPNASFEAVTEQLYNELVTLDRRIGDSEEEG